MGKFQKSNPIILDNSVKLIARRVVDRGILNLLTQWLRAPAVEEDEQGGRANCGP
jgi:hypothetical protein